MTLNEVKELLKRIKSHYNTFVLDEYKIKEWHEVLKEYDSLEVNKKLESHLRSEQYGMNEPKVYYLVKYLVKVEERKDIGNILVRCHLCNKKMDLKDYDLHYGRELSVDYIEKQALKHFNKQIDREKYLGMNQVEFDEKYDILIERIHDLTDDLEEKKGLENIILTKGGFEIKYGQ